MSTSPSVLNVHNQNVNNVHTPSSSSSSLSMHRSSSRRGSTARRRSVKRRNRTGRLGQLKQQMNPKNIKNIKNTNNAIHNNSSQIISTWVQNWKIENVVNCVTIIDCNYRENSFLLFHFSFNVFYIIIPFKQTQTLLLTFLRFSTTLLLRRLFVHFYRD